MTAQTDLFTDFVQRGLKAQAAAGEHLKRLGIERVGEKGKAWITAMRVEAMRINLLEGSVTTDELRLYAEQNRLLPHHDNCWGAIFRGPRWQVIGRRPSRWASCHAREIKIWRYVGPVPA